MAKSRYGNRQSGYSNPQYGNNNIEKYLKAEIDFLLAPSFHQLNNVELKDVYIPVSDAEIFLSGALSKSYSDKVLYLTGLTGSGKSMILRNVFQYTGMTPVINNKTLVIPFTFDNFTSINSDASSDADDIENTFANMLNCSCELLEKTYPRLKKVEDEEDDFFELVFNNKGDFSQVREYPRPNRRNRLQAFMKKNPIPFFSSMLKFYLNQAECEINNLVIITDDIEGAGENNELIPIRIAYKIITCLENPAIKKNWALNLVVGCRNYVYRLITNNTFASERQHIETYTVSENFHLENPPSITSIVHKRYEAISKNDKSKKWKLALDVAMEVLVNIDSTIGEFILNLKIKNIREALAVSKRLIYNKQWVQRDYDEDVAGAFTIDSIKDYDITPTTLLRAIGMRESLVYNSEYSDIPNVIYNENDTDLYPLLALVYCLSYRTNKYADWSNTINIPYFYKEISDIFGSDNQTHKECFKYAIEYFIINRILLRSIDQLQKNAKPVSRENAFEIENVYISNAGVDLWDMLKKNSILLEMYMDDIYLDNSQRNSTKRPFRGFDSENFEVALDYVNVLLEKEKQLRSHASNLGTLAKYTDIFGKGYVCEHLFKGLRNSLNAFYKENVVNQKIMKNVTILEQKIQEAKKQD